MLTSHNGLYTTYADLYAAIADDRNFEREISLMGALCKVPGSVFLELFAGPGYHSCALQRMGSQCSPVAIDQSPSMAETAQRRGYAGRYIVADVLEGLEAIERADIVCIPRYSIVLVDAATVDLIFERLSSILKPGSFLFIEVHSGSDVPPGSPSAIDWQSLSIHKRTVTQGEQVIDCYWPAEVSILDEQTNTVAMKVRVVTTAPDGVSELMFTSIEHLHSKAFLEQCATRHGLRCEPRANFPTRDGLYIAFTPQDETERIGNPDRLVDAAFNRLFQIDTEADREVSLLRSGLDSISHDSPLSAHVYNLL